MRKRRVSESCVAITRHELEGEGIKQGWNLLPLETFIKEGDTVVITPNWVKNVCPSTGTIVGPGSLHEIIKIVKGYYPKRVVIACGSGGTTTQKVLRDQGFADVLLEEKVEFIDLNYGPYMDLKLKYCLPDITPMNTLLDSVDVLISYTPIKHHEEATVSLGLKNIALSWPPAEKHGWPKKNLGIHNNLHQFIAAMGQAIPVDLTILSGTHAMVGTGPAGGKPVNSGVIVMGTDPISTDVVGARLLGFTPQAVQYLWLLIQQGVGEGDLNKVQLSGMTLADAEAYFSQAAYNHTIQVDLGSLKGVHI